MCFYYLLFYYFQNFPAGSREYVQTFSQTVQTVNTPSILSCKELRKFWVSWEDNTIQVGSGDLYQHSFIAWTDPLFHPVGAVSFSTGYGAVGEWQIEQREGIFDLST